MGEVLTIVDQAPVPMAGQAGLAPADLELDTFIEIGPFLDGEQIAAGLVRSWVAFSTSDCTIASHAEQAL
jgi:hypothetical protein